jgi:3-methyl-2-oxobutanoate hydroxymethyltransferase
MNIHDFICYKQRNQKISMITAYDYGFAKIIQKTPINLILVGDSVAMTVHGFPNTLSATVEMMVMHTAAVARGAPKKFIVGDLPFMSYRQGLKTAMKAVEAIMRAGASAVKLEGCEGNLKIIRHCVESGVPVMGHIGLMPQSVFSLGGYKVQGKDNNSQQKLLEQALALEQAGCFAIVLECVTEEIAQHISQQLTIPTIGIGAGRYVDGQVLVLQDLLGLNSDFKPKFVKSYLMGEQLVHEAISQYHDEVISEVFPELKNCFMLKVAS